MELMSKIIMRKNFRVHRVLTISKSKAVMADNTINKETKKI